MAGTRPEQDAAIRVRVVLLATWLAAMVSSLGVSCARMKNAIAAGTPTFPTNRLMASSAAALVSTLEVVTGTSVPDGGIYTPWDNGDQTTSLAKAAINSMR